ncbi:MAG: hypothetical protein J6P21_01910 [Clostridia bacterium]|nr:hypothetical protein [Clostridia bacterium]
MKKKLSKKFLSSIAASMMVFGAAPKSNAQTLKYSVSYRNSSRNNNNNDIDAKSLLVAGVGLTAIATIIIAGVVISGKAYEEKMQKRQDKINTSSPYIKNLAQNLKTILNDDLFDSLIKCGGNVELRIWQNKVLNYDLSVNDLEKIINELYIHWLNCYSYISLRADAEVRVLRNKHWQLVEKKRHEENMRLLEERNRIEREKLKNMGNNLNYGVNRNISYEQNISYNYNFSSNYQNY